MYGCGWVCICSHIDVQEGLMLLRVSIFSMKRSPMQRRVAVKVLRTPMITLEERMLSERELLDKNPLWCSPVSPFALSQTFYPFVVFALHGCLIPNASPKTLWSLLLLAMHTIDPSLKLQDAQLFGGTSVLAQRCIQRVLGSTQTGASVSLPIVSNCDDGSIRLVALLMTLPVKSTQVVVDEIAKFKTPLQPHILQLLLSTPLRPHILDLVVKNELSKFGDRGIDHIFLNASMRGLLANDHFFSAEHFQAMHTLLMHVIDRIGSNFDYLSLQWAPLLNKLSRIYMRQLQGESLTELHFRLLAAVPSLETKLPLTYLIRCIGSLMDTGVVKGDSGEYWRKITTLATLTVRLYGSQTDALKSIWVVFFKAAVSIKPCSSLHTRVLEAYHVCAMLGNPIRLDKSAFSQVIRFMVDAIRDNSIQDVSVTMDAFSIFLKEHLNISFLWVTDGVIALLSEMWCAHGMDASPVVRRFIVYLEKEYFPSVRATGVRLEDNPFIRRLLENFQVIEKSIFWWQCGCGTKIPASAKRCLTCLRGRNVSWTCGTCGAECTNAGTCSSCACGTANPRSLWAARAGILLCTKCGDVVSSPDDCKTCGHVLQVKSSKKQCTFCKETYSRGSICCPVCYEANEEKNPMLWRCDSCGEYNQTTWTKCQRCPGRRKVGCVIVPMKAWKCGCGQRNHPCRLGCEICSQKQNGIYTCDSCGTKSFNKMTLQVSIGSTILQLKKCESCGQLHPRDRNVLESPFLPRHCHRCGSEYVHANLSSAARCAQCFASLSFNELNPFICSHCENKSIQTGYQCMSCCAPRIDLVYDDVFVWRCLKEEYDTLNSGLKTCGRWNYSWNTSCSSCSASRPQSKYEYRARFSPWMCRECQYPNLATNVLFCAGCDYGLQPACECFICGLTHISVDCCTDVIPTI